MPGDRREPRYCRECDRPLGGTGTNTTHMWCDPDPVTVAERQALLDAEHAERQAAETAAALAAHRADRRTRSHRAALRRR
ncbi:hypothetical protein [Allokutzneria albata]|uniref:Uncharacterized protein n=1 Tax=Allokutzneria albata TaxID=211114 RepID=A0A1H0DTL7_ALLAB|nr:hypothetical protein [Allokutzneria albata]SDN73386.1 hypothetical protein SAMN04489726_7985 [Allokutzneria albata]